MGDLQVCSSVQQSGIVLTEGRMCSRPPFSPPSTVSNEGPSLIPEGSWEIAEQATNDIVRRIQPTVAADKKRRDVIEYVQSMIRDFVGCEVFPYGSVPLKTYLHDGDIDLSAVSSSNIEDTLVSDIHAVLKREEQKKEASFQVTDVHCIDAEVKLVKCLVQNIVVDISFNQLGGLGTLCFLEQVNQLVGKDHLFKRSIILTKAWCYYESRILGAHHGLISTYALETLVLYIFHLFHSSLNSPLAVLYRFLDYFSKFDWENYCVSLDGPVSKSSLPHIVAEVPQNGGNDLLLTEGFMKRCVQMFSVPSKGSETNSRAFSLKHFNIIDPLKENNNLGRSVNKGNFYRIRSAFKYGARTLRQILLLPKERIADELNKFFSGTLERHESNHWTCVQDPPVLSGAADTDCSSSTYSDICFRETVLQTLSKDSSTDKTSGMQVVSGFRNEPEKYIGKMVSSQEMPESCRFSDGNTVSACFSGTATQIVTTGFLDERRKNKPSDCLPLNSNVDALFWRKSYNVPQSYFSGLLRQNEKTENGISCRSMPRKSVASDAIYAVSNQECVRPTDIVFSPPAASFSKNVSPGFRERELTGISGSFESPKSLLDLGGDYKNHFWSILHGQDCHLFTVPADVLPYPPMAYQLEHTYPWGPVQRCLPLRHNVSFGKSKNALGGTEYYPVNPPRPSGIAFNSAEKRRHRGRRRRTSNVNHSNWDKPSSRSGTFQEPGAKGQQHAPNKGSSVAPEKRNASKEDNFEVSAEEYPVLGHGKSSSNLYRNHGPAKGPSNATGLSNSSQKLESESPGSLLKEAQCPEEKEQLDAGPKCSRGAARSHKVPAAESSNKNSKESVAEQSYHLMNEVDFPPLSI